MQASVMRIRITPPRIRMRMSYLLVEDNITHKGAGRETEGSEYEKQRI